MRSRLLWYIVVLTGAVAPLVLQAASPSSILVRVVPENPAPNEMVNISLESYANDLDSVSISWSVDGTVTGAGMGLKTFSVKAPAAGTETRVTVSIVLPDGTIEKTVVIRPSVMTLLWQANDSYVPPFYKGKALPTEGSEIKIVAIPEIKNGSQIVSPKNLVYAWKKDYTNEPAASGFGKNFYVFTQDYLDDANTVSVAVSTTDQKQSSSENIDVRTFEPEIVFYRHDANLGTLWGQALSSGHVIAGEEVLEAVPYFVSPGDIRVPSFSWNWSINDIYVNVVGQHNFLPLRAQAGVSGVSTVKLELSNKYKLFMSAEKEINVQF